MKFWALDHLDLPKPGDAYRLAAIKKETEMRERAPDKSVSDPGSMTLSSNATLRQIGQHHIDDPSFSSLQLEP